MIQRTSYLDNYCYTWAENIEREFGVDPVSSLKQVINTDPDYVQYDSFLVLSYNAIMIKNSYLPSVCKPNATEEEISYFDFETNHNYSDYYEVSILNKTGTIIITEKSTGISDTLNIDAAIDGFSWSDDGLRLVYWLGSRIYVYDAAGKGRPIELYENFQQIKKAIWFVDNDERSKVVACTENKTLIAWDSPFVDTGLTKLNRDDISMGTFVDNTDAPMAIYIKNNEFILNTCNEEKTIPVKLGMPFEIKNFTVSHDVTQIAFTYYSDKMHTAIIEISTGALLKELDFPFEPKVLKYGLNDDYLFATGLGCGVMRADLNTGAIVCSKDSYYMHNIAFYNNLIVTTDYYGNIALYDQQLLNLVKTIYPRGYDVPYKDLKVADKIGFLFTINRGGGETMGCRRFNLNTEETDFILVGHIDKNASNTAVAVSLDEEYVAYGYPNGEVYVYETRSTYLVDVFQSTGECIESLQFSEDGSSLYALGKSGHIYMLMLEKTVLNDSLPSIRSNWKSLQERYDKMINNYYSGLLK